MADNILLNSGTGGATIRTDDDGTAHWQYVKLSFGADNTQTIVGSTTSNPLPVDVAAQQVDDAAFTPATDRVVMVGAEFDDTTPDSVDEGDGGAIRMSSRRELYVQIRDAAGNERGLNIDASNRIAVDASGVAVPVTDNSGSLTVDNSGTFAVQEDGAALTSLQLIDDAIVADDAAFTPATTKVMMAGAEFDDTTPDSVDEGDAGALRMSANRNLYSTIRDAAGNERGVNVNASNQMSVSVDNSPTLGANSGVDIGDVDVTSIAAGSNNIGNVGVIPRTSGGMSIFRSLDIDESEEEIKATAGQVFSISAFNRTAAPLYLKFYNLTAANTTVGTSTPVLTFVVPANADSDGAGFIWNNEIGFEFDTAISVACTTGVADNDTGAPGANDCVIDIGFS